MRKHSAEAVRTTALRMNGTLPSRIAARSPFFLPALNYYLISAAATLASFFLFLGVFHDGDEPSPWLPALLVAAMVLVFFVFLREVILRLLRWRFMRAQNRLDKNLDQARLRVAVPRKPHPAKLSLERNAEILKHIRRKSEAAKTLMRVPEGHYEVFELCREYISLTDEEMPRIGTGSPRLAALRRGREIAGETQRFHLLTWAEIESRRLTLEAHNHVTISDKIDAAQRAHRVIESALEFYPHDEALLDSSSAISDLISQMRIGHWIEQAERASFKGQYRKAISLYKDALFFMARERNIADSDHISRRINAEIESLELRSTEASRADAIPEDDD